MESMWNIELDDKKLGNLTLPNEIIETQCKFLREATQGKIIAKIFERRKTEGSDDFSYEFFITSPFTPNYKYSVMKINHKIPYYPLEIDMDTDIAEEIFDDPFGLRWIKTCADEAEFVSTLSKIINSKKVKNVIDSLYAIAKSHERRNDELLFDAQ